ncbi:MAG TPA: ADP-forming succinate--CoA ligase subunit beta [Chromatiales bacterium]|nr:ADP-forming succinate--CoA ligase subunit beta [Chromatiaceae bacterium]HIB83052.1 ADP-forming succinate--CoA ligase subunit beta [Chromatiaceae bacterium]HIO14428.1 ADP-forming succinate--CoA ligase subunit beta [Chromatiales bacterium]HIO53914.1 ADP-forming succinate--CoA ligase subunit beta [Chromatiales bacterium]
MNLHEYQAKDLFRRYQIPVPAGAVVSSPEEVTAALQGLSTAPWVVKAQVHAGGRGKGGGIQVVADDVELGAAVVALLGSQLVTPQTDAVGLPVNTVLIEEATAIERELYLGLLIDRAEKKLVVMASAAGGMDIEAVAASTPDKILTAVIDPVTGLQGYQVRDIGFGLGLSMTQIRQLHPLLMALERLFHEQDASLVEINPLVINKNGDLLALDAKINLDDSAVYRHADLQSLQDPSQEDTREAKAQSLGLNYITLDGNIGCLVNGAGLAMATMDLVQLEGGKPANFLDVGGGATAERVAEAFKLILSDAKVNTILVNIFGGIVRCDLIAEGILAAVRQEKLDVPVIVRLEGTNVELGKQLIADSGLDVIVADDLTDAATQAVQLAGTRA